MPSVEETVQVASSPAKLHRDTGVEGGRDSSNRPQGDAVPVTAFDQRDKPLRDASRRGEVRLPPAASTSECAYAEPEPNDIHLSRTVEHGAHPPIARH